MNSDKNPIYVNITALGVVKIILVFILFYFLYRISDILAILFVSLVLASAFDPWVDYLQKKKIPRGVSMILIYFLMFFVVFSVIALIIPPILVQVVQLSNNYPFISDNIRLGIDNLKDLKGIEDAWNKFLVSRESYPQFVDALEAVFMRISNFIGGIFAFFLVLVITFYMVVEESAMKKVIWSIAPKQHQIKVMTLANKIQKKIGLWLRGQLILSLIIFSLIFVGLKILRVEYALVLALIAGLTEFVPYLGPILAAIPAIFLAFTQKPMLAIFVAALYYIVQLVENNIIVPKLMQKVVGLNPIVSIAVLLIGFKLAGVTGAILSIPVTTAVKVVIVDIFEKGLDDKENNQTNQL